MSQAAGYRLSALGPAKPSEFALSANEVSVGSAVGNDLRIEDASVSRRHAKIVRENENLRITDLQSTNGTFLNGRRVTDSDIVRHGDELRFGVVRYRVRDVGGESSATTTGQSPDTVATPLPVTLPPKRTSPINVVLSVVLLFAIGFAMAEYVVSWGRIEDAAEYVIRKPTPESRRSTALRSGAPALANDTATPIPATNEGARPEPASSTSPVAVTVSNTISAADRAWLDPLNSYRATVGLGPVAPDPTLSAGDAAHARYLVKNYENSEKARTIGAEAHSEDPSNRWYTAEGAKAAAGSDITEGLHQNGGAWLVPADAMEGWVSIPFHRVWMLNPDLHRAGYGQYCENGFCVASLNLLAGTDPLHGVAPLATPIEFPASGSTIAIRSADREWPNPLTSCPGYTYPMGLPITLQLGALVDAHVTAYSLMREGAPGSIETCAFDATTYANPDPVQLQRAREVLHTFGTAVVIPREPLEPGKYTVSITAGGKPYTWSFSVSG